MAYPAVNTKLTSSDKYLAASKTSVASEDDSEPTSNPSQTTGTEMNGQNIFEPVSTGPPAASIKSRDDHPVANDHVSTYGSEV